MNESIATPVARAVPLQLDALAQRKARGARMVAASLAEKNREIAAQLRIETERQTQIEAERQRRLDKEWKEARAILDADLAAWRALGAKVITRARENEADVIEATVRKLTGMQIARGILADVSRETGLPVGDILGPRRDRVVILARHEAINRVSIANSHWSLPQIGRFFNGRDHTTVMHALKKRGVWPRVNGEPRA